MFSTKYKTTVSTQVSAAIDKDHIPNSARTGLIKAIFQGGDIGPYVLDEMTQSLAVRVDRMYDYAKNNYPIGLPSSYAKSNKAQLSAVQEILEAQEGQPVQIVYCHVGSANILHQGWMQLNSDYSYDVIENTLKPPNGDNKITYWLEDMQIVYGTRMQNNSRSFSMEQWGTPPTGGKTGLRPAQARGDIQRIRTHSRRIFDQKRTGEAMEVSVLWLVPVQKQDVFEQWYTYQEPHRSTFRFDIPEMPNDADFYHVKYTVGDQVKYWMYQAGSGGYPILDSLVNFPPQTGQFLPYMYFRFMGIPMSTVQDSEAYRATKKMASLLGLDYPAMEKGINENPDVKDIEQAMLIFAVPASSQDQVVLKYLCDFFDEMYIAQETPQRHPMLRTLMGHLDVGSSAGRDVMYMMDTWFKMSLGHSGVFKARKAGTIGEVGTYKFKLENNYYDITELMEDPISGYKQEMTTRYRSSRHVYQHQVSYGVYMQWEVDALVTTFYIYGEHADIGTDDEEILLIPLDRSIITNYSMAEREQLYARGMHYVFNSKVVTAVKWYQNEWFGAIMNAVGLVLTFVSFGTSGTVAGLVNAVAAGAWGTVVNLLLTGLIQYVVVSAGLKLFVELVGIEIAGLLAFVAMAYSVGFGGNFAKELMSLSQSLIKAGQEVLKDLGNALQTEADMFGIQASIMESNVRTAQQLLEDAPHSLHPFMLMNEQPGDFFYRTTSIQNPGVLAYSMLENYHANALKLPTIDESFGDF